MEKRKQFTKPFTRNILWRGCLILLALVFLTPAVWAQAKKEWKQAGDGNVREAAVAVLQSDAAKTVLRFQIGGYYVEQVRIDDSPYLNVSIPGAALIMQKGFPQLPKIRRNIMIPDDAAVTFTIKESKYVEKPIGPIAPSKGHLSREINPADVPYTFDPFYKQDRWFPPSNVTLGKPFILRDFRGVAIQFNPYQYNPVKGVLKICTHLVVEVATQPSRGRINLKTRKRPTLRASTDMLSLYNRRFVNYADFTRLKRYAPVQETGRLLVVVSDNYVAAVEDFVAWKRARAITTLVARYPADTGSGSTNLKNYIQGLYDSPLGLTYIILVGDSPQIPTITGAHPQHAPSDPMYVKLDGGDNYPDAFISRISAATLAEIRNQLTKSINYERFPHTGAAAHWYGKGTGVASNQGNPTDWERCNVLRTKLLNYNYTLVDQIYDPGATDAAVTAAVNNGRSIINYLGHGSTTSWGTTGFNLADILALSNGSRLPFIIDVACMNGNFPNPGGDCFAERWLKAGTESVPKGAIGIYASSRNADWVPPCVMQEEAVDLLVTEQCTTLGGLAFNGVMKAMDDYPGGTGQKLMEQYNLFGDCTLELRTKPPRTFTVTHPAFAPMGTTNYTVLVKDGASNALIGNARVALLRNGQIVASRFTSNTSPHKGTAIFPNPLPAGNLTISVTKTNYVPYTGNCNVGLSLPGSWWVSFHWGATMPYDEWYDSQICSNAIVNIEYRWRFWAIVLDLAYNDFILDYEEEHFQWWNFSPSLRYYVSKKKFQPFVNVAPGLYVPSDGPARFGFKVGIGFDYQLSDRWMLEMGTDYHHIFMGKEDGLLSGYAKSTRNRFQHFHMGVVYNFK